MSNHISYAPNLTELLDDTATFSFGSGGEYFALTIPRKRWEEMGRPGSIFYTPVPIWPMRDDQACTDVGNG